MDAKKGLGRSFMIMFGLSWLVGLANVFWHLQLVIDFSLSRCFSFGGRLTLWLCSLLITCRWLALRRSRDLSLGLGFGVLILLGLVGVCLSGGSNLLITLSTLLVYFFLGLWASSCLLVCLGLLLDLVLDRLGALRLATLARRFLVCISLSLSVLLFSIFLDGLLLGFQGLLNRVRHGLRGQNSLEG